MVLVFLNINIDLGASRIGLIPNFLGYIFMLKGIKDMSGYSVRFVRMKQPVKVMIAYSAVCYAADLLGLSFTVGWPMILALGLISLILSLLISYNIIMGVIDIETERNQELNSRQLYSTWKLMAAVSLLVYVFYLIPMAAAICIIIGFVISIVYLIMFNKSKRLFYEQNPVM